MDNKQSSCYDDIIYLQRPVSKRYPKMSAHDRAAQFSPFAALEGYDEILQDAEHERVPMPELLEDEKAEINDNLMYAVQSIDGENADTIIISYFLPDETGKTGWIERAFGRLKKFNANAHTVEMEDGTIIAIDNIIRVDM